ncbi:MAG: hypothetical protein AUI36_41540 [Cyanobacteria bacterium 13_1_40CM_2_61_4]|nr:MAG: hypothetical protein AUI36_41540 [Cyanobacteria bacterium 13_1_40CM_2_61_4]
MYCILELGHSEFTLELLDNVANTANNVCECNISIFPGSNGFAISRQSFKFASGYIFPTIERAQKNSNYLSLPSPAPFQGTLHLQTALLRSHKRCAQQQ